MLCFVEEIIKFKSIEEKKNCYERQNNKNALICKHFIRVLQFTYPGDIIQETTNAEVEQSLYADINHKGLCYDEMLLVMKGISLQLIPMFSGDPKVMQISPLYCLCSFNFDSFSE